MYARKVYMLRQMAAGDPGFFSKIGGFFKKAVKIAAPIVFPGIGGVASSFISAGGSGNKRVQEQMQAGGLALPRGLPPGAGGLLREGAKYGGKALLRRFSQSGRSANVLPDFSGVKSGSSSTAPRARKRYRRMHVTNMKALTRAVRRVKGFSKIARTALVLEKRVKAPRKGCRGRS